MAATRSNKELAAEAEALAIKLGRSVTTDGLKNQELSALVDELKAADSAKAAADRPAAGAGGDAPSLAGGAQPKAGVEAPKPAVTKSKAAPRRAPVVIEGDEPEPDGKPPAPAVVEVRYPYTVASGKCINGTAKGTLQEGEEIRPEWLDGGQAILDLLVKKGAVVERTG